MNANIGHGHVFPRPDGVKMRCGGPALCNECARDSYRQTHPQEAAAWNAKVYLRQVDAGTDNACWVVCAKGDPGGR